MACSGDTAALALDEAVIEADLRRAVSGIDTSAPGAAVAVWNAFLEHAARPLAFGDAYDADKDNDLLNLEVERIATDGVHVTLARRVGVVLRNDAGYQGTIISACYLTVAYSDDWSRLRDRQTLDDYGPTGGGAAAFRRMVEASFGRRVAPPRCPYPAYKPALQRSPGCDTWETRRRPAAARHRRLRAPTEPRLCVKGHRFLPSGGHRFSPLADMVSLRWWPSILPSGDYEQLAATAVEATDGWSAGSSRKRRSASRMISEVVVPCDRARSTSSHELARVCGAEALLEKARVELAASGVRVRRPALTGADSLTPSERRIAAMAAAGASNSGIAPALFVTLKTVEMHLSNAYRKLGITKRTELAAALDGGDST